MQQVFVALGTSIPFFAFLAFLTVCLLFRGEIRGFLAGLKTVKTGVLELSGQPTESAVKTIESKAETSIMAPSPEVSFLSVGQKVKGDLDKVLEEKTVEERMIALENITIHSACVVIFGRIYLFIFGSQITLLDQLSAAPIGLEKELIRRQIFEPIAKKHPKIFKKTAVSGQAEPFDAWLNYLTNNDLIVIQGNKVAISTAGKEFLIFLVNQNLSRNKPC